MEIHDVALLQDLRYELLELNVYKQAVDNLLAIQRHVKQYGITKENTELFAQSFEAVGWDYSVEGIISKASEAVWNFIKKIAAFIKNKCIALLDKIIQWFQNIFSKRAVTVPPDKKDEFDKRMLRTSSNEVVEAAIRYEDLKQVKIIDDNGRVLGVDDIVATLPMIADHVLNIADLVMSEAASSRLAEEFDRANKTLVSYNYKTFYGCYAAGWGDGAKLKRLSKAALSVKATMQRTHDRLSKWNDAKTGSISKEGLDAVNSLVHLMIRHTSELYIVVQRAFDVSVELCDIGKDHEDDKQSK